MQALITVTLQLLIALVPLAFTTVNYELFEFPKFILLLSGTLIIVVSWGYSAYRHHDYRLFPPFPNRATLLLHSSVLAILGTQILATLFSVHPYTSWWGYYSRFHQGLLTTICYTVIYFSAVKWLDKKSSQKLIKISIGTAIIVSLYAIFQHFGIDKNLWVQDVVNRPFSSLGQPNWLAAYLLPHLFLLSYFSLTSSRQQPSPFLLTAYTLLFAALLFTKSRSGFLAFLLAYPSYWFLLWRNFGFKPQIRNSLFSFSALTLVTALILGTPFSPKLTRFLPLSNSSSTASSPSPTSSGTQLASGGTESGEIRKIVWTGALQLIKQHPLLGTGPETFAYTYYWVRPEAHNYTSEWDFIYNKAHNEYLNFAATSGLIGLAAYLFWHYALAALVVTRPKSRRLRAYYPTLAAALISFTITNFFGFSVIPVYLTLILFSALANPVSPSKNRSPATNSLPLALGASLTLLIIFPARLFLADLTFARGKTLLNSNRLSQAQPNLERAVKLRPQEDLFHSYLGELYAQLAAASANREATVSAQRFSQLALAETARTAHRNPWHLNYLKSRAKTYLALAQLDPRYYQSAVVELARGRELAPTDPKLAYNLGLIYSRLNNLDASIQQMRAAINLKNNYYEPYYALTLLYESTHQEEQTLPLLQQAQAHFSPLPEPLQRKLDQYSP